MTDPTKKVLLFVADGPEHIEIYTSEEEAIVDSAHVCPALYLTASIGMHSFVKFGPFLLSGNMMEQLKGWLVERNRK